MRQSLKNFLVATAAFLLVPALTACEVEEVIHGLDEREANEVIELLDASEPSIKAMKLKEDGRVVTYKITVPANLKVEAYKVLNKHELPRKQHKGYNEIFAEGGLIPTKAEEQAKSLSAIQGEVGRSLQLIPNVLESEVNIVIPEENPLANPDDPRSLPSASVTLKYLPINGQPPATKDEIQRLVAFAVKDMKPERVEVFMAASLKAPVSEGGAVGDNASSQCPAVGTSISMCSGEKAPIKLMGRVMCPEAAGLFKMLIAIFVVILLLLAGTLVVLVIKANAVKSKLVRLQNELAARRRRGANPSGAPAPAATGLEADHEGSLH